MDQWESNNEYIATHVAVKWNSSTNPRDDLMGQAYIYG